MIDWHVPDAVTQRDPQDECQFSNCWAAVGVWLVDAGSGGAKRPAIRAFKKEVGPTEGGLNPTSGCPRGLEEDVIRGLTGFGIELVSNPTLDRDEVVELLAEPRRRVFGVAVDYHLWPEVQDCSHADISPGTNHMVGLVPGRSPNGAIRVMNPMCTDPAGVPRFQKVALEAVVDCAQAFAASHGRSGVQLIGVKRPFPTQVQPDQQHVQELMDTIELQRAALRRAHRIIMRALDDK